MENVVYIALDDNNTSATFYKAEYTNCEADKKCYNYKSCWTL